MQSELREYVIISVTGTKQYNNIDNFDSSIKNFQHPEL